MEITNNNKHIYNKIIVTNIIIRIKRFQTNLSTARSKLPLTQQTKFSTQNL